MYDLVCFLLSVFEVIFTKLFLNDIYQKFFQVICGEDNSTTRARFVVSSTYGIIVFIVVVDR